MRSAATALLLTVLLVLPPALHAQHAVAFDVDTNRSTLTLEVQASVLGVTASDETSSRLAGVVMADLTPAPASFSSIHINQIDLTIHDDLFLRLDFGLLGRLDISAPPEEITLSLLEPGEPAAIADTSFEQTDNSFAIRGTLDLNASGLIGNAGIGDSTEVDTELSFDVAGSITETDEMIVLRLPMTVADTTEVNGVPLILRLDGIVVATAPRLSTSSDRDELPAIIALSQNYPNPFNPSTAISFTIERAGHVTLHVYDALGRRVATLVDAPLAAGSHEAVFDAADLPSGIYVYRLASGGMERQRTMVLVR